MKTRFLVLILPILAGCFSAKRQTVVQWGMEFVPEEGAVQASADPKYESVRLSQVAVRAPYDVKNLAVLRADGSLAYDPLNEFASSPVALAKSVALDVLQRTGVFRIAVGSASTAHVTHSVEFNVRRLALDCREGAPVAVAEASVLLLQKGEIVAYGHGEGRVPVAERNFNAAFSRALTAALTASLRQL